MAKEMTLYWGSGSPPCWRALLALEEKSLQGFSSKLLSFDQKEHKGPDVMKINPRGQLPAFQHGKIIINESFAICEYLEDTFKGQGAALMPEDPVERALMRQRMHEGNTLMSKFVDVAFYVWKTPEAERNEATLKRNQEALTAELQLWEDYMQKTHGQYLAGKNFTLADVIVFPVVAFLFRMGLSEEKYPKFADYYNHLKTRPSVQNTWPPTWKETPGQPMLKDI